MRLLLTDRNAYHQDAMCQEMFIIRHAQVSASCGPQADERLNVRSF